MKIYISYFYQVRFFTRNMLPVSTAMWDPKWYFKHIDANGIVNGLRAEMFVMPQNYIKNLEELGQMCRKDCPLKVPCLFMKDYRKYLDTLDFNQVYQYLENILAKYSYADTIVLMVHEKDTIPCAERPVIQEWFKDHGIELKEWYPKKVNKITNLF